MFLVPDNLTFKLSVDLLAKSAVLRAFCMCWIWAITLMLFASFTAGAQTSQTAADNFETGRNYHDGNGVEQNYDLAQLYYNRAAAQGSAAAMLNLGYMNHIGDGVAVDYDAARDWYIKAMASGSRAASKNLNLLYELGLSLPPVSSQKLSAETVLDPPAAISRPSPPKKEKADIHMMADNIDEEEILSFDQSRHYESLAMESQRHTPADFSQLFRKFQMVGPEAEQIKPKIDSSNTIAFGQGGPLSEEGEVMKLISIWQIIAPTGFFLFISGLGLGIREFIASSPQRFANAFVKRHNSGLRQMYKNFTKMPDYESNRRVFRRALSDMIDHHAKEGRDRETFSLFGQKYSEWSKAGPKQRNVIIDHVEIWIRKHYAR